MTNAQSLWDALSECYDPALWYDGRDSSNLTNRGWAGSVGNIAGTASFNKAVAGQLGSTDAWEQTNESTITPLKITADSSFSLFPEFEVVALFNKHNTAPLNQHIAGQPAQGWQLRVERSGCDSEHVYLVGWVSDTNGNKAIAKSSGCIIEGTYDAAGDFYQVNMAYSDSGDRKVHLYLNGVEVSYTQQDALSGVLSALQTFTVMSDPNGAKAFGGKLDELQVYDYVMGSDQRNAQNTARLMAG